MPQSSIFAVGWFSSFYGKPTTLLDPKVPARSVLAKSTPPSTCWILPLLNNDLLLLRIYSALRRLRRYSDHGFSGGQRRREVMETAVWV